VLSACLPVSPTRNHRRGADFGKELGRLNREALFGLLELVDTLVDRPSAYARLAENLGLVLRNAAYLLNLLRAHQAPPHAQPGAAMHNIAPRRCSCSLSCLPGSVMTVARHRFHVLCMLALRQDTGCSASSASAAQRLLPGR